MDLNARFHNRREGYMSQKGREKKGLKEIDETMLETFHEGLSAQIMHIGSYSEEGSTIQKLHNFIKENGYMMRGLHHEIYMSDPRRTPPERWKTIIRQPIEKIWSVSDRNLNENMDPPDLTELFEISISDGHRMEHRKKKIARQFVSKIYA